MGHNLQLFYTNVLKSSKFFTIHSMFYCVAGGKECDRGTIQSYWQLLALCTEISMALSEAFAHVVGLIYWSTGMVDLLLLLCGAHKPFLLLIIILDICSKDVAFFFKLPKRIEKKFSDIHFFWQLIFKTGQGHPWVGCNILLFQRPQLQWHWHKCKICFQAIATLQHWNQNIIFSLQNFSVRF